MGSDEKADQLMPGAITTDVTTRPDRVVVAVSGELDFDSCTQIRGTTDAVPLHGRTLTLEMAAVTFMDSSGLNMLLDLRNRAHAEGGTLELAGLPRQAQHVLDVTGTRHLFTVRPCPAP
ncbi:STAS domain-containing protein [Streptomyces sp. NPDC093225]|uniref:STAS domain-containing protein n=1 Tax=Streptomyces sp. NPDC093225 TaxID=3366034 RepID=UPI0037FA9F62